MDDTLTPSKVCFKCGGDPQPLSNFYAHKMMAGGHLNKCKECTKRDTKSRFVAKREDVREYDRQREKTPERQAQKAEYQSRHRSRHPEKYRARQAVGNAVRDGRLIPQHCEVCGSAQVQAHHEDYSKPLDVKWLCFKHHRADHRQDATDAEGALSFSALIAEAKRSMST